MCAGGGSSSSAGSAGLSRISAETGRSVATAQRQQPAEAVAKHDRRSRHQVRAGDRVLGVGVEVELGKIGRLGPVVAAQVERVAFPAAWREVAQVALPQP